MWRLDDWFPEISPSQREQLKAYNADLSRWTKKINLISSKTIETADLVHFADSILGGRIVFSDLPGETKRLWDLGSGNGFPGVVIAMLQPSLPVTCVDSDERKIGFLKNISLKLDLRNLNTLCERVEKLPEAAVGCAVTRGFASISKTLELCERTAARGCRVYHFKGADWEAEMSDAQCPRHWKTTFLGGYDLDLLDGSSQSFGKRAIVLSVREN